MKTGPTQPILLPSLAALLFCLVVATFTLVASDQKDQEKPGTAPTSAEPEILAKAKSYCRLLQSASLDFVCREEIKESIRRGAETTKSLDSTPLPLYEVKSRVLTHQLVYDYQFVRNQSLAKEKRVLIKEDGVPRNEADAELATWSFHYANVLFGPAAFLDQRNAGQYDFEVEGPADIVGEAAIVIAGRPRAGSTGSESSLTAGRLWVATKDGAVLKIEWDPRTLGNRSVVEERAKGLKAEARLTMTSEFGFVKNGLRFPSRHTITEAYVSGNEPPVLRAQLVVEYGQYRFFTVETTVTIGR